MDGSVPRRLPRRSGHGKFARAGRRRGRAASDSEVRRQDASDGGLDAARAAKMAIRNREPEAMVRIIMATFLCLCAEVSAPEAGGRICRGRLHGDFCVGFEFASGESAEAGRFERGEPPNGPWA